MTEIEIPEGARVGSAADPGSPQPIDGDRLLILERPALPSERLPAGQIGIAEVRTLTYRMGDKVLRRSAPGCPWVHVAGGRKLLAKRWAILTDGA